MTKISKELGYPEFAITPEDVERQSGMAASCDKCHKQEVSSTKKGSHRNLSCEACHTPLVAGYAFNFWAPGKRFGMETPLDRHQFYNVNAMPPIILKDRNGQWNPYHIVPYITTNIMKEKVELSRQILFRSSPDVIMKPKVRERYKRSLETGGRYHVEQW